MPIVFACGAAHAPGIIAWTERAPKEQAERFHRIYHDMHTMMEETQPEAIVALTSEHWTNFFLDNYPPFCIGTGEKHFGPTEEWLGMEAGHFPGDTGLAGEVFSGCSADGFDLSFSESLKFDHGLMVPLYFMTPNMDLPIIPILINTVTKPMPHPSRCFDLGAAIGKVLEASPKRIAVMATGGLSHWPGEIDAGKVNEPFDRQFLQELEDGDFDRIRRYTPEEIDDAGGGGQEVRNWITLAGCVRGWKAKTLSYEPVPGWATGCGLATFERAA